MAELKETSVIHLTTPLDESCVRGLCCGQQVLLSGTIYTARDAAHKYLAADEAVLPAGLELAGMAVYHCGPVMIRDESTGAWRVTAAGPTTSSREEPYMGEVIRKYALRAIIGKGGMGEKTLSACRECGCVYLSAVGGAAQVLSAAVTEVQGVFFKEEFGSPEAIWKLTVRDFPAIVTMDANGRSLHREILEKSAVLVSQG